MSKKVLGLSAIMLFVLSLALLAQQRPQGRPPRGMRPAGGQAASITSGKLQARDADEQKILDVLNEMDPTRARGMMNVPPEDGRLLRMLTETTDAKKVVEIGTSNGYSGIWFSLALRKTGGKLITHEIDPGRAELARKNFARAGVAEMITLVEGDAHENVAKIQGPIDIVFVDADKEGYSDYLNQLLPKVRPGGLIIAHNTTNAGGAMGDYIEAVTTDKNLETLFINSGNRGVGVTLKKR